MCHTRLLHIERKMLVDMLYLLIDVLVYVAHYTISNLKDFAGEINMLINY